MHLSKRKAGLVAAAGIAASVAAMPLSAHEHSFAALQSIDAQALSSAEMDAVHGEAYTLAVLALLAYAAKVQTTQPQVATQYTTIAASLSKVTVPTTKIAVVVDNRRLVVRR